MKNNTDILRKGAGLLLLLALLIPLAACGQTASDNPLLTWDSQFVEKFHPDPSIAEKLAGNIQDLDIQETKDGVTVQVNQTLGDDRTLYIALEVTFPEDVDMGQLNENGVSAFPETCLLVDGVLEEAITYEELEEMRLGQRADLSRKSPLHETISGDQNKVSGHTIPFVFGFEGGLNNLKEDTVTLVLSKFCIRKENEETILAKGPFVLSWERKNQGGDILTRDLIGPDGAKQGTVVLSPFSLTVDVNGQSVLTEDGWPASMQLISVDGKTLDTQAYVLGGSWIFRNPLDIERVQSLQIGNYSAEF